MGKFYMMVRITHKTILGLWYLLAEKLLQFEGLHLSLAHQAE